MLRLQWRWFCYQNESNSTCGCSLEVIDIYTFDPLVCFRLTMLNVDDKILYFLLLKMLIESRVHFRVEKI